MSGADGDLIRAQPALGETWLEVADFSSLFLANFIIRTILEGNKGKSDTACNAMQTAAAAWQRLL